MSTNLESNFNFQEQLRRYVVGELSAAERAEIERTLSQSPEAMVEANFSMRLANALKYRERLEVSALVGSILAEEGLPPTDSTDPAGSSRGLSISKNLKWLLGLAAMLVIGFGVYQIAATWYTSAQALSEWQKRQLEPLENVLYTADATTVHWQLKAGMDAYDAGDYAAAIDNLKPYYEASKDPNVGLFYGVALLMRQEPDLALPILQTVEQTLQGPGKDAAQWYLAAAWLQKGRAGKARGVLRRISEQSLYYEQAQELLSLLK